MTVFGICLLCLFLPCSKEQGIYKAYIYNIKYIYIIYICMYVCMYINTYCETNVEQTDRKKKPTVKQTDKDISIR